MYYAWLLLKKFLIGKGREYRKMLTVLNRCEPVILDIRNPIEFKRDHLEGSVNIALDQINAKVPDLIKIRKPIIVTSRKGRRSEMAAYFLKETGLEVYDGGSWSSLKKLAN